MKFSLSTVSYITKVISMSSICIYLFITSNPRVVNDCSWFPEKVERNSVLFVEESPNITIFSFKYIF